MLLVAALICEGSTSAIGPKEIIDSTADGFCWDSRWNRTLEWD